MKMPLLHFTKKFPCHFYSATWREMSTHCGIYLTDVQEKRSFLSILWIFSFKSSWVNCLEGLVHKTKSQEGGNIFGEAFAYLLDENYWDEWSKINLRSTLLRHHLIVQPARGEKKDHLKQKSSLKYSDWFIEIVHLWIKIRNSHLHYLIPGLH